jgi:superfamily II DNA/RNA helicase
MKFKDLNLDDRLLEAISYMGFETATPVQEQAIPLILDNRDILACAQTGTGKTGAFVLPILHKLAVKEAKGTDTLIIVPTRELAVQIEQQIQGLSYFVSVGSLAIYGGGDGKSWDEQKKALKFGMDIIVATPGKLISHLKMGYVNFSHLKHLVLDEADRMLDMGFIDDLKTIISYLPEDRQTLMFSATMPPMIGKLGKQIMKNPAEISLSISKPAAGVDQKIYLTHDNQKVKTLCHILSERKDFDSIIIFAGTKSKVSEIAQQLTRAGFPTTQISSNLEQDDREEVLRKFRAKRIRILAATDVMSRGIDIKEISMVVNYDVPSDAADYVHRVGRTARASTTGEAITLVNDKDMGKIRRIETLIESSIPKLSPPAALGPGPEWNERSEGSSDRGPKKPWKKRPNNRDNKPRNEGPRNPTPRDAKPREQAPRDQKPKSE